MRFIFSVKRELQYIDSLLKKEEKGISKRAAVEIENLYRNILGEMNKLLGSEMFEQVQEELGASISGFCRQLQVIRHQGGYQIGQLIRSIY